MATWQDLFTRTYMPGQILTTNLPARGLTGDYVIQKVTLTTPTPTTWLFKVEFGGRLLGIADVLRAIVSAQQKKKLSDTTILHKIKKFNDDVDVTDSLTTTPRTPPFICGDADAICGFVLVSS